MTLPATSPPVDALAAGQQTGRATADQPPVGGQRTVQAPFGSTDTGQTAVSFRPDVLALDADGGHLLGSACPSCQAHFFPTRQVCSACLTEELTDVSLSRHGTLYSYTVVRQSVPGFTVPYLLCYVDLPEGVRVLGQLDAAPGVELSIGAAVSLVTQALGSDADGRQITGYRFTAIGGRDE